MRLVLDVDEIAAEQRTNAKNIEIMCGDARRMDVLARLAGLKIHAVGRRLQTAEIKRWNLVPQQLPLLPADPVVSLVWIGALNMHEDGAHALRLRIRQALQHQSIHNGEDGGVGSDRESQGNDDGAGESGIPQKLAQAVTQVMPKKLHACACATVTHGLLYLLDSPEICECGAAGLRRGHAGGNPLGRHHVNIRAKLTIQLALNLILPEEISQGAVGSGARVSWFIP